MSRKNIVLIAVFIGLVLSLPAIFSPHESKPPKFQIENQVWPSCHWDGSQGNNDWEVEFYIIDWKKNKTVWKRWVATGISEKAAEQLCDAYNNVIDLSKK